MPISLTLVRDIAKLIKIEHSIFALPFAYTGMLWAAGGWPGWRVFVLVSVAMVAVRSFAMAVNRVADLPFDRANPRTQDRPLVSGALAVGPVKAAIAVCAVVFVLAAAGLNTTVLALSPFALFIAGGYSYAKRFTWLCHYWLGATLGLAPLGGWLAVTGQFHLAPVLLGFGVCLWVAGFDILYALQDQDFDRDVGLYSIPARFGTTAGLGFSEFSHLLAVVLFALAGWAAGAGVAYFLTVAGIGAALLYEHSLVSDTDLSRIDKAFFTVNGVIAMFLLLGVLLDFLLR